MSHFDVIVLGAGAAGMFCAIEAGRRGRRVALLDHAKAPGEKIRISGGGRCNFTNLHIAPERFLSDNPRFALSALKRYTQWDFIDRVSRAGIAWHEKALGQLFCDGSAREIIAMLRTDMQDAGVTLVLESEIGAVTRDGAFHVATSAGAFDAPCLVVATGGKSIPKMGATGLGYTLARQFGLRLVATRPGLVPLTLSGALMDITRPLAGLSVQASVTHGKTRFNEGLLFTHRGLSGPSILQISSYWRDGAEIAVNLAPDGTFVDALVKQKAQAGRVDVHTALARHVPERLARVIAARAHVSGRLADQTGKAIDRLVQAMQDWRIRPVGSEGYRTAEVTLGGVDTRDLDARSMQARAVPGLHFIGEAVDVTGWLGGYNFQWAWSSGWVAGQAV